MRRIANPPNTRRNGETFKECEQALEEYMEENPDEWYSLHEFTICDD
jgi:hypothetical protein